MSNSFWNVGILSALLLVAGGIADAKEIGSGAGGGVGTVVCNPVSSLTAKGDPRVGETGLASVQIGWGVKPCNANQAIVVTLTVRSWNTGATVYSDTNAAANSKITLYVPSRQLYYCTITVVDAFTGATLGTSTVSASTVPKGGV